MGKTHKTAVVLIPPREAWPAIQSVRRQYDRHVRRWMPHITLLYPFAQRGSWPLLTKPLQDVCSAVEPFEIELAGWDRFCHGSTFTVWLAPKPGEKVRQLQAILERAVPQCSDTSRHPGRFTPHLTLGQVRGHSDLERMLTELEGTQIRLDWRVDRIHLIWRDDPPRDIFEVGCTISLSGG